ncbi:MAG: class I SAM-dependent methyltransferase [Phreatobacter sp.]|uniref:class I SAM-dependent methyltransferase n=1 Tax=Phreatobacter sp. TaxID=1966341 RepID=UPI001A57E639|nr:class I SAM-dependent methyltransferase [Phreatobacter sp.]MBL8570923.1 class I SAM-dependent methyltransferase [Phreatobacter sp.]
MTSGGSRHWETVYATKAETEVSWFQDCPTPSLAMIATAGATSASAIVDIGGGESRLVDALVADGHRDVTVLDLSGTALQVARHRMGAAAVGVEWIVADVTAWRPARRYDVWHDRAAFHFLIEEAERAAYVAALDAALPPGGHAIIATFALDGPERCSGLPVARHDGESLARVLGAGFRRIDTRPHSHVTPWGTAQSFQFSLFRKE